MRNLTGILAVFMVFFVGLACSGDDTEKANTLIDEANKFVTEANNNVKEAETKGKEFDKKVSEIKNDADHDKVSDMGKNELMPLYDKMKDNFQKAGEKFEAASKLKVNDKFKEYLENKGAEFKKRAEYADALKAIPKALTDNKDDDAYQEAVKKPVEKAQAISKEAQALADKATKIQNDNPDIFKKQ